MNVEYFKTPPCCPSGGAGRGPPLGAGSTADPGPEGLPPSHLPAYQRPHCTPSDRSHQRHLLGHQVLTGQQGGTGQLNSFLYCLLFLVWTVGGGECSHSAEERNGGSGQDPAWESHPQNPDLPSFSLQESLFLVLQYLPPGVIALVNFLGPQLFTVLIQVENYPPSTEVNLTLFW